MSEIQKPVKFFTDLKFEKIKCRCDKHKEYEVVTLTGRTSEPCPFCVEEEEQKKAQKKALELKIQHWEKSNVEEEYWGKTLADFQRVEGAGLAYRTIADLVKNKSGEVVLLGNNGNGKTLLGSIAVMELGGYIYSLYEISTMIRQSYTIRATETELEIVNRLARCPLLVIDEIGRTNNSEAEQNWLSYVIDKRHVRNLPFILISNELEIEKILWNDVLSRLQVRASIVNNEAGDYRRRN